MDRSDTPTLLLPLLALLAIAFPFAMTFRAPAPSGGNNSQASQTVEQESNQELGESDTVPQPHSAAKLIEDFLHAPVDREIWPDGDPRSNYSLDFMIAIVADPIDSRLTRIFDSSMDSIQRAFEASGYQLDRFDLAWSEPASRKTGTGTSAGTGTDPAGKTEPEPPRYRREPSLLLFRKPDEKKLFLVFLVGETPTSGLHKAAMSSALLQLANFFPWGPGPSKPSKELRGLAQKNPGRARTIKIMGPSFSGSAPSLEFALRDWLDKIQGKPPSSNRPHIKFRIVSGSATAIDPKEFSNIKAGGPYTFQAVVPPDKTVMPEIFDYIRSLGHGIGYRRIAMLSESGTAYGQASIRRNQSRQDQEKGKEPGNASGQEKKEEIESANNRRTDQQLEIINLPFPLHISQLRTESEKQRESQQKSSSEVISNPVRSIHLKAGEASQPRETPPSFSSLGVPSSELVLSGLLSTISHEGIHAVGILATDMRDIIFLAGEIHQHCPGTLVFAVTSDLLYSHPDVGPSARGMLVFTPYPLYNLNQVWTPPFLGRTNRVQFPSQDAEGVYNATLALIDRDDLLLDYGQPFPFLPGRTATGPQFAKPALWVTVVGRNGPLPVTTLKWRDPTNYALTVPRGQSMPPTLHEEGIYTSSSVLGIVMVSFVFIGFSVLIVLQYHSCASEKQGRRSGWISRILGEPVTPPYQPQAYLYLLVCLVCLLGAYILLAAIYSLPEIASRRLGIVPEVTGWRWLVALVLGTGLVSLACAVAVVLRAFWKAPRQHSFLQSVVKGVVLFGCVFVAVFLAPRLALVWISTARSRPTEAILTYVRAFQFFSGLSPLVPLFFVALAGFLWALCSFRRLRMIDGIRPTIGVRSSEEYILGPDTQSFRGVKDLEIKVREKLENASAFPTNWYIVLMIAPLLAIAWIYLFISPFVPSYEGIGFHFLFGWGFFLVYFALTTEFGRLCLAWAVFRHLLQRLAVHPMQDAYGRYRESFKGFPRIDLAMPFQVFSVLSFSVVQAERMLRMAHSLVSSPDLSGNQRQNLQLWILEAERAVPKAAKNLSQALKADANGQWRLAVVGRSQSQRALGKLALATALLLEPAWRTAENNPPFPGGAAFKEFRELGEEFLAGRTVLLISYVLPSLRKVGTFILTGLLLMLFSVMFYPFVQKNHFLAFNWIVILAFVGLALLVMLQMERDVVLSALNGTKPGQVKVTRQFTFRILAYVMVPILLLLSAQFPDTLGQVISWFSAFQGH